MWQKAIISRPGPGTRVKGEYIGGAYISDDIKIVIEPMDQAEIIEHIAEGDRGKTSMRIFTKTVLRTVDEKLSKTPDLIVYNGLTFKIVAVDPWGIVGGYWTAIISEVKT